MTNRLLAGLVAALLLVPAVALAQASDDWEGFKPAPASSAKPATPSAPPPAKPAPAPAAPVAAPAHAVKSAAAAPAAPAKANAPVASSAAPDTGAATLISTKESVTGEEAPHSPSTLHNDWNAASNLRNAAGEGGSMGVLHVESADFGRAGLLHFSASGEFFSSSNFPVLDATETRNAGVFSLGYNFTDWLQAYANYTVAANTNSRSAPNLIQDQGDAQIGLVGGYAVARGLSLGLDLRALLSPGTGDQDISKSVFGFEPRALLTYDWHALSPKIPIRTHLNLGVVLDKTDSFADGHTLTAAEEFALGANHYNRFEVGAAIELGLPAVTPFIEYNAYVPLGASDLIAPDNTPVSLGAAMDETLGLGVRVTAIKDVTLNAAVDMGLARTVAYGIPATMPWNFIFGAAYTVDVFGATRTKVVDRTYERKQAVVEAPKTGRVEGTAVDATTGRPLSGVLVAFADRDLPPVASDAFKGRFMSYELPAGPVKLHAELAGYQPAVADATIEAGKVSAVQVKLVPVPKPAVVENGSLSVKVTSHRKPVAAKITAAGPNGETHDLTGNGAATTLPAGHYTLAITADGFDPVSKQIDIPAGKTVTEKFELKSNKPAPKRQLVVIVKNKVVIKQQVHFATNKAVILHDSYQLLDQVADAIKSNGLKKVLVEGHTDNVGAKDANLKLSQDRANAVRSYLIKRGVKSSALEAKGFGDTRPIAPNMTAKGRELNRRVEFTIEEH